MTFGYSFREKLSTTKLSFLNKLTYTQQIFCKYFFKNTVCIRKKLNQVIFQIFNTSMRHIEFLDSRISKFSNVSMFFYGKNVKISGTADALRVLSIKGKTLIFYLTYVMNLFSLDSLGGQL